MAYMAAAAGDIGGRDAGTFGSGNGSTGAGCVVDAGVGDANDTDCCTSGVVALAWWAAVERATAYKVR